MYYTIANSIAHIIKNNIGKIDAEYQGDGGYEGWMQVELADALRNRGCAVQREAEYPYLSADGSRQRCDIVANGFPIELKVDTARQFLKEKLVDDAFKVHGMLQRGQYGYAVRISKNRVDMPVIDATIATGVGIWRVDVARNDNSMELENENIITDVSKKMRGGSYAEDNCYFITVVEVMYR